MFGTYIRIFVNIKFKTFGKIDYEKYYKIQERKEVIYEKAY